MDPNAQTRTLIEHAKAGDRLAFDRLVNLYRARLESLIRLRLGNRLQQRVDVDDVLQETLLNSYRGLGRFEWQHDGSFFHWLAAIAERIILDLERKHLLYQKASLAREVPMDRMRSRGSGSSGELRDLLAAEIVPPSRAMRRDERLARLERALAQLSPDRREVLLLSRVQGIPTEEVARRMARSPGAVSMLILRALRDLKAAFGHTDSLHLPDRTFGQGGATDVGGTTP